MLWVGIATVALLIWIYLLAAHGGFWRVKMNLGGPPAQRISRRVVAVIPARNEADVISDAIGSLLTQDFPSPVHIVLVDDGSSDSTASVAQRAAVQFGGADRLTILRGAILPPGWTGKVWAMSQGLAEALKLQPDYILFTDADIRHDTDNVAELVSVAESGGLDLASYMVRLKTDTVAEELLMPAFVYFFFQLYPPAWSEGAAGGCMLVRPSALARIGGLESIRGEIIDDCALARAIKVTGGKIWLRLTAKTESLRSYGSFAEVGAVISRSAYNQLHHSLLLLAAVLIGMLLVYAVPVAALFSGNKWAAISGGLAWLGMTISYAPMVRFYRMPLYWAAALPLTALFYLCATVHSAIQYLRGQGGVWKGRAQDV